uniref:Putative secreted protein n=1 Tax=Ixodes ricinus TaxID=34613 RepID=A0A6B0UF85_IXORI
MVFLYIILSPFSSKNHFFLFFFFFWNCEGLAVMVSCVAFPYSAVSSACVRVLFSCDSFEGSFLLYSFRCVLSPCTHARGPRGCSL